MLDLVEDIVIRTKSSEIILFNEEVIHLKFKTDKLVLLEEAFEIDNILTSFMMDAGKYVMLDALNIQSNMNSPSQKYFAKESQMRLKTKGVAILLNNLPIRLTASVFIKFHKPPFPTKIFGNSSDALNWFDSIQD